MVGWSLSLLMLWSATTQGALNSGAESGRETGHEAPSLFFDLHIIEDFKDGVINLGDRQNQITLLSGALSFVGARFEDAQAQNYFSGQNRIGHLDTLGNDVLGTGIPGVALGLGLLGAGAEFKNTKAIHAGIASLEALAVNFILTDALKFSVRRERPNGSDSYSFPSGHVSTVSTSAMVLEEFYGWRFGVPVFALAGLTAMSRMSADEHWLSDVSAGALIGILVGHAMAKAHLDALDLGTNHVASRKSWLSTLSFSPWIEEHRAGMGVGVLGTIPWPL